MSHEVIVVGGGFTGLAACMELERRSVPYLLVEVKRTLGGSLRSVEQGGVWHDCGAMAFVDRLPEDFLASLGLADQRIDVRDGVVTLPRGMGQLVTAMSARLTGPRMMRTAVSSLGLVEGQWGVCMENGVLLTAPRVIVAAPARYAARMLTNPLPEALPLLLGFVYGDVTYVSLLFDADTLPERVPFRRDVAYIYHLRLAHPLRVGDGRVLIQVGLRLDPRAATADEVAAHVCETAGLPAPLACAMGHWPESDALSVFHPDHSAHVMALMGMLPPRLALANSDFTLDPSVRGGVLRLAERLEAAHAAVTRVLAG